MAKEKGKVKSKKRRWNKDDTELTLLALPTTIWYFLFCFAPMFGIVIAFKDFKINGGFLKSFLTSRWVGFNNFKFLFSTKDIWMIVKNTLAYNIVFIILGIVVPVAAAIAIGQLHSKRLTKIYQTAMFMPYFLSWVVVTALVWAFLSYDKGLVNNMLESLGMERQQWYMKPAMWPPFLVFMNLWKGVGYGMVVYLATIMGIDSEYYEAARVDGANIFQQIWYITLPLVKPTFIILLLYALGSIMKGQFELFYQMIGNNGVLYNITDIFDTYVYRITMTQPLSIGLGTAAGLYQSLFGFIIVVLVNFLVKRKNPEYALF